MKIILQIGVIIILSGCVSRKKYGDFVGSEGGKISKGTIMLSSPVIDKNSLAHGPLDFVLTGLPGRIDPLTFNVGQSHGDGGGGIKVEVMAYPERKWIGTVVIDSETKSGKSLRMATHDNAIYSNEVFFRVTALRPLSDTTYFTIRFAVEKDANFLY